MFRAAKTYAWVFLVSFAWDLLTGWAIRYTADRDIRAVGWAVALTLLWWFGVSLVNRSPGRLGVFLLGAGAGTWVSISVF